MCMYTHGCYFIFSHVCYLPRTSGLVSVEEFYTEGTGLYYWLNNFDNIFRSFGEHQFWMISVHSDTQTQAHKCSQATCMTWRPTRHTNAVNMLPLFICASISCVPVILFELLLGNNWHVLMDGFAAATGNLAVRVYFIVFTLIAEVCSYVAVYVGSLRCSLCSALICIHI